MKTERISILGTPEFKAFLVKEAEKEGISLSELIRRRCTRTPTEEEALLRSLAVELKQAVAQAKRSLDEGVLAIQQTLADLASARTEHQADEEHMA